MLNQQSKVSQVSRIFLVLCLAVLLSISFSFPSSANDKPVLSVAYAETGEAMAAADGIGSKTITVCAEPADVIVECVWTLSIDESKMSTWLVNRVKEKELSDYIQLTIDGNECTVTALQYFKYGIKYTTYYTLTATCLENPELTAVCYITLG